MGYSTLRWTRFAYWNLWPAARLLLVLAALAVWMHQYLGVEPPSPHMWGEIAGGLTILLIVCTLLSLSLARLYLALLCFPFFAAFVLNSLFYDGIRRMLRQLIGPRPACLEALCALAGELALFMSVAESIVSALRLCCRF